MTHQPPATSATPHLLIRASAGTGKTFQLSNRYLHLVRQAVPQDRILATTFTRKAAGEILDRVVQRLAEAATDERSRRELARFTGGGRLTHAQCLDLLMGTVRSLHRLRVSTLDSLFSQIARSFSLELGLPPGWEIVDDLVDKRLRREAIHRVLSLGDAAELRTLVQLLAKGEANRGVSQLVHETVKSLYDLFLATEARAWQQVPRGKPFDADQLAAALEQLRSLELPNQRMTGARNADYDRAVEANWSDFLGKGLAAKVLEGNPVYYRQPIPEPAVQVYQRLIQHATAELLNRVALQTAASYDLLAKFHGEYQQLKQSHRAMRFEDVTRQLAQLRDVVEPDRLAFRLDARIEHLLLDEFQDTSVEQWQVIEPLARRLVGEDQGTSFFCVGDVKQAIYGWRGGVAEIFDAIDRQLGGLQSQLLNVSYRSSPAVIEAVNAVFAGATRHSNLGRAEPAVQAWCARFEPHRTAKQDLPGYVELRTAARREEGETKDEATLRFAAAEIARHVAGAPGCNVGVLVRTNLAVGRLIYELRRLGIPASEEGGNPLTDSAAVAVILSALQLADHPGDSVARFHLATSPLGPVLGLGTEPAGAGAARRTAAAIRRSLIQAGYGPTVNGWAKHLASHGNRREQSRLTQMIEMAYGYDARATLRTADFVQYVRTTRVADPLPADVRVMTIHQAKGLEFDIVVLPELESDLVGQPESFVLDRPEVTGPIRRVCRYANADIQSLLPPDFQQMFAQATHRDVTESLCVLYVALTRAVHALQIVIAPSEENERTLPRTYAGLLRAALRDDQPTAPDTVLYRCGDAAWAQSLPRPAAGPFPPEAPREPVTISLAPSTGGRRRGWQRTSPSALEGGTKVRLDHVLTEDSRSRAMLRGGLIHAWFEHVGWIEDGTPDETALRQIAQEVLTGGLPGELDVQREAERFAQMLRDPNLAALLSRQRYQAMDRLDFPPQVRRDLAAPPALEASVQAERGFAYRDGERLMTGFIDRLVLLRREGKLVAAEIIDYKTDAVDAAQSRQIAERTAFYAPQIAAYRSALARLTGLDEPRILTTLAFVEAGQVVTVRA